MNKRIRLAAYLAHTRRADGSWTADWTVARLAGREARYVLRKHLANEALPEDLTLAAHAASEDLRASALFTDNWAQVQAQLLRVLPVVQCLLRTLATLKKANR